MYNSDVSDVVKMLDKGVPVDTLDEIGFTALSWAVIHNFTNVLDVLLQRGADVNRKINSGVTPLHIAVLENNTGVMRILLRQGASTNIKNDIGNTPLDTARLCIKKEAAQLLKTFKSS